MNANNIVYEITKENGKTGTIGTVVESIVERALEDKVIKKGKKFPSGFVEMTTTDYPLWNAYAAAGMLAAINVNIGAARAAQGVPATILYYNDLLEHETSLPASTTAARWVFPSVCRSSATRSMVAVAPVCSTVTTSLPSTPRASSSQ